MTDERGLFEHARLTAPRLEHGYCLDDNARLLSACCYEADADPVSRLSRTALTFVLAAIVDDGRVHNRMDHSGHWTDEPGTEDCWGRAVGALGVAAVHHPDSIARNAALNGFNRAIQQRSTWVRAMAFAARGAAEVLISDPTHDAARALLHGAAQLIPPPAGGDWAWPEARLRYANATLPEALLACGAALHDNALVERGTAMLHWLMGVETRNCHLSPTGVSGRGPGDTEAQFDQQPIEVAATADACSAAFSITGDTRWLAGVELAAAWFLGRNDAGLVMFDRTSGGAYDGLHRNRVNLNQGAESTLAYITTMQRARALTSA